MELLLEVLFTVGSRYLHVCNLSIWHCRFWFHVWRAHRGSPKCEQKCPPVTSVSLSEVQRGCAQHLQASEHLWMQPKCTSNCVLRSCWTLITVICRFWNLWVLRSGNGFPIDTKVQPIYFIVYYLAWSEWRKTNRAIRNDSRRNISMDCSFNLQSCAIKKTSIPTYGWNCRWHFGMWNHNVIMLPL